MQQGSLRLVDFSVAGIQAGGFAEVVDDAVVRHELAVLIDRVELLAIGTDILGVFHERVAATDDQRQVVHRANAQRGVGACLAHIGAGVREILGRGEAVRQGWREDQIVVKEVPVAAATAFELAAVHPHGQVVHVAERVERTLQVQVQGSVGGFEIMLVVPPRAPGASGRVDGVFQLHHILRVAVDVVAHVGHGFPVVAQLLVEAGEHRGVLDIVPAPGRGQVGAARQAQIAAVREAAQGVAHAIEVVTLVAGTEEQQGVVAGIELERHIIEVAFLVVVVDEVVFVFQHAYIAPAQAPIHCQRAGYIEFAAVVVPAAGRSQGFDLRLRQRALVAEVDHPARFTCAVQTVGTPQQAYTVELGKVFVAAAVEHARRGATFIAHIVDFEATGHIGVLGPCLLAGNTGHLVHHLVHVAQLLVLQALIGDDGYRLRNFAQFLRPLAAHGGGARRIAAGVFRAGAQPLAFDVGG